MCTHHLWRPISLLQTPRWTPHPSPHPTPTLQAGSPEAASQALTSLARQRWQAKFGEGVHIDDVTVVVCYL